MKGRVYQRGSKWWVDWSWRGQRYRLSGGTEKEARALLKTKLAECALDQFTPPDRQKVTVAQVLDCYQQDRESAKIKALSFIRSRVRTLKAVLGDVLAVHVSLTSLQTWVKLRRGAGKADGTIVSDLSVLRAAFRVAKRHKLVREVPDFPQIALHNARQGFVEPDTHARLLAALKTPVLRDMAHFAYWSGWRRREIQGLRWDEVDRAHAQITLRGERTKNGKARTLPLVGDLGQIIERRWEARVVERKEGTSLSPWVFHRKGKRVRDFAGAWDAARVAIGRPDLLFHDYRRTAVRNLILAGVAPLIARTISGHESDAVFSRYAIITAKDQRGALEAVERHIHGTTGGKVVPLRATTER